MWQRVGIAVGLIALLAAVSPAPAGAEVSNGWDHRALTVGGSYDALVGNFGGDASTDLIWWPTGGEIYNVQLWLGQQGQRGTNAFVKSKVVFSPGLSIGDTNTTTFVVGDFAGDEGTDVFLYGHGTNADYLFTSQLGGSGFTSKRYFASGNYLPTVLHDDHAGAKDDLLLYQPGSGKDYVWHFADDGSGATTSKSVAITSTFKVIPGDWNGDGLDDVVLYAPGTRADHKWVATATGTFVDSALTINGTYDAMAVQRPQGDGIFWWSNGPGGEAYWRSNGSTFTDVKGVLQASSLHATLYPSIPGTVILAGPEVAESTFFDSGTNIGYGELDPGHDYSVQVPLVGDFDHDGATLDGLHADIAWYGVGSRADALWYGDVGTAPAATSRSLAGADQPSG